jgi:hypothetical protein
MFHAVTAATTNDFQGTSTLGHIFVEITRNVSKKKSLFFAQEYRRPSGVLFDNTI